MRDQKTVLAKRLWRVANTYAGATMLSRVREVMAEFPDLAETKPMCRLWAEVMAFAADPECEWNLKSCIQVAAHSVSREVVGDEQYDRDLMQSCNRLYFRNRLKLIACFVAKRLVGWNRTARWAIEDLEEKLQDDRSQLSHAGGCIQWRIDRHLGMPRPVIPPSPADEFDIITA